MSSRLKVVLALVAVVVAAAAAGIWWFLRDDAPAAVDLGTAVESVTTSTAGDASAPASAAVEGVEGTWRIDADSGSFDFESATGTFAGFRIQEELSTIGSTTAVGRTGDVSGSITIEGTTVTAGDFAVDLTTITTNQSRRDSRVQDALETGQFPTATFVLTAAIELGAGADGGQPVAVTASGDLTIHGVTRSVEFPIEAQLVADTIVVVGSLDVVFAGYGVEVPSAPIVLSVEDHGTLELQLLLTRSS